MSKFSKEDITFVSRNFIYIKQVKWGFNYAKKIAERLGKTRQGVGKQLDKLENKEFLKHSGIKPRCYELTTNGEDIYDKLKDEVQQRERAELQADYLAKVKNKCGDTGNEKIEEYLKSIIKCGNCPGISNIFEEIKNSLKLNEVCPGDLLKHDIFLISDGYPEEINLGLLDILQEVKTEIQSVEEYVENNEDGLIEKLRIFIFQSEQIDAVKSAIELLSLFAHNSKGIEALFETVRNIDEFPDKKWEIIGGASEWKFKYIFQVNEGKFRKRVKALKRDSNEQVVKRANGISLPPHERPMQHVNKDDQQTPEELLDEREDLSAEEKDEKEPETEEEGEEGGEGESEELGPKMRQLRRDLNKLKDICTDGITIYISQSDDVKIIDKFSDVTKQLMTIDKIKQQERDFSEGDHIKFLNDLEKKFELVESTNAHYNKLVESMLYRVKDLIGFLLDENKIEPKKKLIRRIFEVFVNTPDALKGLKNPLHELLIWYVLGKWNFGQMKKRKDTIKNIISEYEKKEPQKIMSLNDVLEQIQKPLDYRNHLERIGYDFSFLKYLFSLKLEYKEYLMEGSVTDELKKAFEEKKHSLSEKAQPNKEGDIWILRENEKEKYIINDTDKELNIYFLDNR